MSQFMVYFHGKDKKNKIQLLKELKTLSLKKSPLTFYGFVKTLSSKIKNIGLL